MRNNIYVPTFLLYPFQSWRQEVQAPDEMDPLDCCLRAEQNKINISQFYCGNSSLSIHLHMF